MENRRTNRSIDVANSSTFRPDEIRRDLRCDASGQLGNDTFEIVGNFERFFQVNPYGGIFGQMMKLKKRQTRIGHEGEREVVGAKRLEEVARIGGASWRS